MRGWDVSCLPNGFQKRKRTSKLVSFQGGLEIAARGHLSPTTRVDINESFVPPNVIIPKPGVDYFEFDWEFIYKHKKRVISRMGELLR